MLRVTNLDAGYGNTRILSGISLDVNQGMMITLIGANGAGKTTFLMTLSGIIKPTAGTIEFMETRIDKLPACTIVNLGMAHVPQGKLLFPEMTVLENLEIGAWGDASYGSKSLKPKLEEVFEYFEVLRERKHKKAGTLSGGEQQMLAIGRALMSRPKLLLCDEPSSGLAPIMVDHLAEIISNLHKNGLSVLLVEQNAYLALDLADRGYVLETGKIVFEGRAEDLRHDERIKKSYLGL
jgi:branched-chain amino acid transport system ATP-binding protein